jgi:hypothetical protein
VEDMERKYGLNNWEEVIKKWEASGQTQKRFCTENGIRFGTFHYYRKRLKKNRDHESKFIEIPEIEMTHTDIELQLISRNIKIKIPYSFDEQTLNRLLKVLGV